jgi:FlaA1/EpsC-like NDP-sugar epimerase
VDKFVMVSTDKAVNPTNIMGTTKRMCEIYIQSLSELIPSKTRFITTRFGNVLGSNGSVIPLFRNQIAQGGPVTVTHREIIRYFMTIPEACQLVLEAGFMGKGGEIFIFDMGKPVRIYDLAEKMISLSGYVPDKDIKIVETGLRPGEKLFEELLANHEENLPTVHKRIMVARMRPMNYISAKQEIEQLLQGLEEMEELEIVKSMKKIVPEYVSENSRYMELDTADRQEQISGEAPVIVKKRRLFKK